MSPSMPPCAFIGFTALLAWCPCISFMQASAGTRSCALRRTLWCCRACGDTYFAAIQMLPTLCNSPLPGEGLHDAALHAGDGMTSGLASNLS